MNAMLTLLVLLILGAPAVYISGQLVGGRSPQRLALGLMAGAWLLWGLMWREGGSDWELQMIAYTVDGLTILITALTLSLGTVAIIYSGTYMSQNSGAYYTMMLLLLSFIIAITHAADLFNLWLWFEAMALAAYMLVATYNNQAKALEASFKYLVQSAAGSIMIVAGMACVLSQTGSMNLAEIRLSAPDSDLMRLAGLLFLIGFGVKAAFVPLHTWLPDAHSQAPSGISALLSGVVIEGALIALLRALLALSGAVTTLETLALMLLAFGVLNIIIGNLLALRQNEVKRLLAYSSVAHMGYIVLGIGVGLYTGQRLSLEGGLFHLFSHGLMKGLAFLAVGALLYVLILAKGEHNALMIDDLSGAAGRYPFMALMLVVALLGLGGLPPMIGFMSKWQVFAGGMATHNSLIIFLIGVAALNSVLSLAYYAPLISRLYRRESSRLVMNGAPMPPQLVWPLGVLTAAIVLLGFWPGLLDALIQPAADALMLGLGR